MKFPMSDILVADLPRKLVAFFFALLIWFAVEQQLHDLEVFHDVPVYLQYDQSQMVVERNVVLVRLTLRGSRNRLDKIQSSDIEAAARVPTLAEGTKSHELQLTSNNFSTPPGVRVSEISPPRPSLNVDRIITKDNVPVRIRYIGSLRDGLKTSRAAAIPQRVAITGPSKLISTIYEILTEPIMLDENIARPFEIEVRLVSIANVTFSVNSVHVTIEITSQIGQQPYRDLPVAMLTPVDFNLQVARPLPNVAVTLHGPQVAMDALSQESVRPFVDISTVTEPGRYRRAVQVWIDGASSITAEYVHPSVVEVVLEPIGLKRAVVPDPPAPLPPVP